MSNYGQQPPYGQNQPNPYGQPQPGHTASRSSRTGSRRLDANLSSHIQLSRARTVSSQASSTRRSSSLTASPAKARTGNSRRSGLRSRRP